MSFLQLKKVIIAGPRIVPARQEQEGVVYELKRDPRHYLIVMFTTPAPPGFECELDTPPPHNLEMSRYPAALNAEGFGFSGTSVVNAIQRIEDDGDYTLASSLTLQLRQYVENARIFPIHGQIS